ncbi:hypothetical protein LV79_002843 [Actinokineospora globicatena]|uniref:hypothetical protein n=1 Tax=Actinokineospora globicatena TaxID=103729 RepID=UPI0020A34861|nr:hypothetical protein [Actinokineospora globicatena]MCP2303138.1 hypothetical protein [Actinokineospora globicatena]GLW79748.1 hypothetical protein Aglo01_42290 [Actinokineospora globicatena]GLW85842.1 hypothetical protein Aglo02_34820 [Actinokineospora globicatena]
MLTVPARFNGPPDSGHGGYTCGLLAGAALPGTDASVTLLAPPPLDEPMRLAAGRRRSALWWDEELIATATPAAATATRVPEPVSVDLARVASEGFTGVDAHPFPTCYACGHERADGSGLRLAPGPVPGRADTVACVWTPADSGAALLWTALDCPGGWAADPRTATRVLTRMTARLLRAPRPGTPHVLVGWCAPGGGRTATTATACYDADGALVATAASVWTATECSRKG